MSSSATQGGHNNNRYSQSREAGLAASCFQSLIQKWLPVCKAVASESVFKMLI